MVVILESGHSGARGCGKTKIPLDKLRVNFLFTKSVLEFFEGDPLHQK